MESAHVPFLAQTVAVGRVGHQQAGGSPRVAAIGQGPPLHVHASGQTGPLQVCHRRPHGTDVDIETADRRQPLPFELHPLAGLFLQSRPESGIVSPPPQQPEVLPSQRRGPVHRHPGRFDQECARAAHGIHQGPAARGDARPAGARQDGRRQVLLQRRLGAFDTVAATVQTAPAQVEADHGLTLVEMDVDAQVGLVGVHRGARAVGLAEVVDHGILDAQSAEVGIANLRRCAVEVHRQSTGWRHVLGPRQADDAVVERIRRRRVDARQLQQHPAGHARPEADPVAGLERPRKGSTRSGALHIAGAKLA